uniref:Putative licpodalin-4 1 n=1 Tax=Ixodes ricinus TaxID=34613 RepID=V5GLL5_IXORI
MKLALSLAIFVCGVLVGAYGKISTTTSRGRFHGSMTTVPPEYDPSKQREQNATRVVQMNATQWVKWRTYNVTDPLRGNHSVQCENLQGYGKDEHRQTNSLQYRYRSGYSWVTLTESLIFGVFSYSPFSQTDMFFGRTPIGIPTHNLVLYY